MSVESTVDYAGYAISATGAPLVDRSVTLKNVDTLATIVSTTTDADGKWLFNDIAPSPLVKAEISAGTTPQISVKRCFSGDVWSLYVREKLTAAPAAIFNLPPVANIYANSVPLATALQPDLDGRYVNVAGDVMTGTLALTGASAIVELGSTAVANVPSIDFHSSGVAIDYDVRLSASGGTGVLGTGALSVLAATVGINGAVAVGSTATIGGTLAVTGATTLSSATLSGVLTLPPGGVGNPSQRFAGDPDTGPYLFAPDNYRLQAGGTDCAVFAKIGAFGYFSVPGRLSLTPSGSGVATPATVTSKYPLYDAGGTIIGYIPIYATL